MPKLVRITMSLAALTLSCAQRYAPLHAQGPGDPDTCAKGEAVITGTIFDPTHALIPGADLALDNAVHTTSGPDGRFTLPCTRTGAHHLTATAEGFGPHQLDVTLPHPRRAHPHPHPPPPKPPLTSTPPEPTPPPPPTWPAPASPSPARSFSSSPTTPTTSSASSSSSPQRRRRQPIEHHHRRRRFPGLERPPAEILHRLYQDQPRPVRRRVP